MLGGEISAAEGSLRKTDRQVRKYPPVEIWHIASNLPCSRAKTAFQGVALALLAVSARPKAGRSDVACNGGVSARGSLAAESACCRRAFF